MLEPGPTANFLAGISFFALWQQVVCAIGLGVLYRRKSTGIAVALIALTLAIVAAFTYGASAITGR